jgi:ribosomal protein L13E
VDTAERRQRSALSFAGRFQRKIRARDGINLGGGMLLGCSALYARRAATLADGRRDNLNQSACVAARPMLGDVHFFAFF